MPTTTYTIKLRNEDSLARFLTAWMNYGTTNSLFVEETSTGFTVTISKT